MRKEPPVYRIEWRDALLPAARWYDEDEIEERMENHPLITRGFLVGQNQTFIAIAHSLDPNEDFMPYSGVILIPKRAILKKERM